MIFGKLGTRFPMKYTRKYVSQKFNYRMNRVFRNGFYPNIRILVYFKIWLVVCIPKSAASIRFIRGKKQKKALSLEKKGLRVHSANSLHSIHYSVCSQVEICWSSFQQNGPNANLSPIQVLTNALMCLHDPLYGNCDFLMGYGMHVS